MNYKKILTIAAVGAGAIAIAFAAKTYVVSAPHDAHAQTLSTQAPTVGIQAAQGSGGGAGGCNANLTNVSYSQIYSNNSNPDDQGDYAGSAVYNGAPYGNTDCARIWLSGQGPYTQDFQIGVRMQNPKLAGGWGPWGWTPWASDIANGVGGNGWSPWVGAIANVGGDPGHGMYQIAVNTRALPAGALILAAKVGLQEGDGNNFSQPPYYCNQNVSGQFAQVYSDSVANGGWSYSPSGKGQNLSFSGVGDVADCTRLFLGSVTIVNAGNTSNNIPSSVQPSTAITTDGSGNPLKLTVVNTGDTPWVSNQQTIISAVGTCDGAGGTEPDPSDGSGSCTATVNDYSSIIMLSHVPSSFGVGADPLHYSQVVQKVCSLGGSPQCTDPNPSCDVDQNTCEVGYCSNSFYTDPMDCGINHNTWNNCNGQWQPSVSCTVTSGDPNVEPGAATTFTLPSLTPPGAANNYTELWTMEDSGLQFGSPVVAPIQVGSGGGIGTITVNSTNEANGGSVEATWDLGGNTTICTGVGATQGWVDGTPCSGVSQTYSNVPVQAFGTNYTLSTAQTTVPGLALKSIQYVPLAQQKENGIIGSFQLALDNMLSTIAEAYTIPQGASQTLFPTSPSGAFTIIWAPVIGSMQVSPSSAALNSGGLTSQPETITASGANGAELDWTAAASTADGGGWLNVTPSGVVTVDSSGSGSGSATISYAGGMPPGRYTGTVTFTGKDPNQADKVIAIKPVSVTLVVSSPVTVSCTPSTVITRSTSQCSATGGDGSGYTWSVSSGIGSIDPVSGLYTAPTTAGTATITATAKDDSSNASAPVAITIQLPTCNDPSCRPKVSITATPATIVIPESTRLIYNASDSSGGCVVSGGQFGSGQTLPVDVNGNASGTITITPSTTTTYTLTCSNANYATDTTFSTVQVTVGGTGRCETNPNGVGCPGQ